MRDAFAVFDLPRMPWMDVEELKVEFHRRSAALHPDAGGEAAQFTELNIAYRTLADPVARLRHLLELEASETLTRAPQVPPSLANEFMRIAAVRQAAEALLVKWRATQSPLARAALAGELAQQQRNVDAALGGLTTAQDRTLARLQDLNAGWRDHFNELAALHAELSYMNKWTSQLRETRLQFDLARG
jgi:DnaJ-domain-containing protein 1